MAGPFTTQRRVEFADTDMAGIAHFTAFFRFMEEAEHALLRDLGLSVFTEDTEGQISWPRVAASCDFRAPARFEDVLDVEVSVEKMTDRSVVYLFVFRRDGHQLAEGRMTSVCCRIDPGLHPEPIAIPADVREKLLTAAGEDNG